MTIRKDRNVQEETLMGLIAEIENLRVTRQLDYANRSHPMLKRFTQQELNDMACPTYKNLLTGRSRRIPDRPVIACIAEYLECTAIERNNLLLAAGYLPVYQALEGTAMEQALEEVKQIMSSLPMPAMVVDHMLNIKAVNKRFSRLFELPAHQSFYKDLNMADLHFNADYPVRPRSTFNAAAFELWESHAADGIQAYKKIHTGSRHESWYINSVEKLQQNSDFNKYWNKRPDSTGNEFEHNKMILARTGPADKLIPIRYKQVHISASHEMYPRIEAYLPVDEAAHAVFKQLKR